VNGTDYEGPHFTVFSLPLQPKYSPQHSVLSLIAESKFDIRAKYSNLTTVENHKKPIK
jgi:hypothetical protein